ncbi:hypothetical protein VTK73DRAFT_4927 [Phialemonium thermophilum]|uniref:Secreted protein n=1 Tax=Phialemonium thermophilum TaxID=223376 RepID=A0ABR3V4U8_9PEZI
MRTRWTKMQLCSAWCAQATHSSWAGRREYGDGDSPRPGIWKYQGNSSSTAAISASTSHTNAILKMRARKWCMLISVGTDNGCTRTSAALMSASLQLAGNGTVERYDWSNGGRPRHMA